MLKKSSQEPLEQFQPNLLGNMHGVWGLRCVEMKGLSLWCSIRDKIIKILINLQKSSFHSQNVLIFGMEYSLGKEIQVCSNKVPRTIYGSTPGA